MKCLLVVIVFLHCNRGVAQRPPAVTAFPELAREFVQPSHAYGSAPLWVWHTKVTEPIIDSMMQDFKDKAFGGVFIHPRPGLITPYLSDEWFSLYRYSVAKGKELGLDVWIYDENSYPSGFAGGHVPAMMPESYNQGQMLNLTKTDKLPEDITPYFIILQMTETGYAVISDVAGRGADTGTFYLFKKAYYGKSPWYAGFSYVDLLARGVTEKFIEVTMTGYEKHIGTEFGRTVPGIFTDEPNIEVQGRDNIRWTPDLFDAFRKRWGYDLIPHLPSLYEEVGDWYKVRHNYYQVLLQLFIDRWSKPWYAYTEAKGLEWTGHYWEHGWPNPNHGGDNMAMYAWHQRPAIDMLFNQFNEQSPNAQFGNIRAVKELSSVANQLGRTRTLSETYGGGGWELTLTDMKRLGDWQCALGVNTLNQHLSHMTLLGARKYDYPQSFSYHNPLWPYYASQNQYFARLSLALSAGNQVNHILIIEPTTSAWMYSTFQSANPRRDAIGHEFQEFVTTLERAQSEYDLGSENVIKDHGSVRNAQFTVGARTYRTVVVPPGMENIDRPTFDLLLLYSQQGGRVLLFEEIRYIDGAPAEADIRRLLKQGTVEVFDELTDQLIRDHFLPEDIIVAGDAIVQPYLYHHTRLLDDGLLLFVANSSLEDDQAVTVTATGKQVLYLDTETGEIFRFPSTTSGSARSFSYRLPPAGSALFFIADRQQNEYRTWTAPAKPGAVVKTSESRVERLQPNVLTIDFCDVAIGDTLLKDLHVYFAADTVFKHHGFKEGNPWNTSVQYKDHTIQRDTFPDGTGFSASYHFEISEGTDLDGLKAVVERADLWQVTINGEAVRPIPHRWWLDKDFAVFDVGPYCRPGNNTIQVHTNRMRIYAESEPVYILGDFALQSRPKGWVIAESEPLSVGSWRAQGMPFYGHEVAYKKTFEGKAGQRYLAKLNAWKGTAAIVKLNGKTVGHVHYPPYELELRQNVQDGQKDLEVIIVGSLKNTLGPHHGKPTPGLVSPWHWRVIRHYPAGETYDSYDYGLLEDFVVFQIP
ncbi:MAG TPA: glycosyl hydrolase [Parapedobacter sp.]|nr:glycosyl hydrolase [Parapedobacter sp.]